jgi:hypothetical protein
MPGAPNLFPSAFMDVLPPDSCSGPTLYKSTQSREAYAPTLNAFMEKYVTGEGNYTDQKFLKLAETMKNFSRTWPKLPKQIQREFLTLLLQGNGKMSIALKTQIEKENKPNKETNKLEVLLSNSTSPEEASLHINSFIEDVQQKSNGIVLKDVKCVKEENNVVFTVTIVIISLLIGFLCSYGLK